VLSGAHPSTTERDRGHAVLEQEAMAVAEMTDRVGSSLREQAMHHLRRGENGAPTTNGPSAMCRALLRR
jgi:hypothetical protein